MDPGRVVTTAAIALALAGAAKAGDRPASSPIGSAPAKTSEAGPPPTAAAAAPPAKAAALKPRAMPVSAATAPDKRPRHRHRAARRLHAAHGASRIGVAGPPVIAEARRAATARSQGDQFVGGLQVFAYAPGRIYEVWTAPLRVTSLTLGRGETVVSMAAGDTVRWQIGETASGEGDARRTHVLIKPLEPRLETNLVLTTNQRLYFVALRSGRADGFNPAVAWTADALNPAPTISARAAPAAEPAPRPAPTSASTRLEQIDLRYRITPRGRRPAWTPTAVMTDGTRTLIAFPTALRAGETPALFAIGPGGDAQMVNYRQQAGLFVVDRVLDRAELRLGDRHAQVVEIRRLEGGRP